MTTRSTPSILETIRDAIKGVDHVIRFDAPTQNPLEQFVNGLLFVGNTQNLPTLRILARVFGDRLRVFGGEAYTEFDDVRHLAAREPEKIDWFSGPVQDRADYLTKSYMPFLLEGPNHRLRREHIYEKVIQAHRRLDDMESLLAQERGDAERAVPRFLFRHFCGVEITAEEVGWYIDYRRRAAPLMLLPKLLRVSVLGRMHRTLQERRLHFLRRIEATGTPIADSWFDVIWFNAGTLADYPENAIKTLRANPELQQPIRDEVHLPPPARRMTRALVHEILRIYGRIASTNHVEEGRVRIALLSSAMVDTKRYTQPYSVDLTRDHSDTVIFAGSASSRKCPAEHFAPDVMATIVAFYVREGRLENEGADWYRPSTTRRDDQTGMPRRSPPGPLRAPPRSMPTEPEPAREEDVPAAASSEERRELVDQRS